MGRNMPPLDTANIAFNRLKAAAGGLPPRPGPPRMPKTLQVPVPSATTRRIVNQSALAVREARGIG